MEMVKQDLYQALEDLGLIWLDLMRVYYGTRYVELPPTQAEEQAMAELGIARGAAEQPQLFDFSGQLEALPSPSSWMLARAPIGARSPRSTPWTTC